MLEHFDGHKPGGGGCENCPALYHFKAISLLCPNQAFLNVSHLPI
jgi:hypothetical protein